MSWKILITDGFESAGIEALKKNGFLVEEIKLNPDDLRTKLPSFQGIIVRSATKVRADLIDHCPDLKFIARAGVGLDNIDVIHAQQKNIAILNTPASSSRSVAELAMSHMLCISRGLQISNRALKDKESFQTYKKQLSGSRELKNRTLLLIGLGRIGRELAKIALGFEMHVIAHDPFIKSAFLEMDIHKHRFQLEIPLVSFEDGLKKADYISIHSPYDGNTILDAEAFSKMKKGMHIINTSRGENMDEDALLEAIESGIVSAAGLDVFMGEPDINPKLLLHPKISITPHIGASTYDAQLRIAEELVEKIIHLKNS
jgi:D-3-phosphoglycerate dehydrogenase / 2-oxoglutarate reductase